MVKDVGMPTADAPAAAHHESSSISAQVAPHAAPREAMMLPVEFLEAAPDAMIVVNPTGEIVYINNETEKLFGYNRAELWGRSIECLIPETYRRHHEEHRRAYVAHPRTRPMGESLHIVALRKDGTSFPADIKLSPLNIQGVPLVAAALRDITATKRTEQQLRDYSRNLEQLQSALELKNRELLQRNQDLEQFAYVSSHDLQEPLRKIIAFGDRLKSRCGPVLDERGLDYLGRIQSAAVRMQQLVQGLLEVSRISTRGRPFAPVDLGQIAAATVQDLEISVERVKGKVHVRELATIDADAIQMRQLLQNLISNALKFHREGVPPEVNVWGRPAQGKEPSAPENALFYELGVEDNGIGIDPKHAGRIFTVFERLNPRDQYEGTGIGLAICKKIAERHGGKIDIQSELGRGATFVVTLRMTHPDRRGTEG